MSSHAFTFEVSGFNHKRERFEDVLAEFGCDDALIAVVDGKMFLDFDREAPSYDIAVVKARLAVEKAGGRVLKVEPITN